MLSELEEFLKILDKENLSSTAIVRKCLLTELLQTYMKSDGCDEEYIYMNKVIISSENQEQLVFEREDGEAVSSSYESYDEEEVTKGKSTTHQWPSTEASIELMKDVRICAFLWRKKWLGQWAKQLCVIRENRLLCYKSSKDQSPQLDVSLVGCSVVYKEKQVKKKEHNLKIIPLTGDVIVLGLQSKEQTEQWLKWKTRWCLIEKGQLYFYQDKSKNKAVHQPLSLGGCVVVPDPSPEHLYSFRILHEGEQRATLEAKSSDEMGHWLGLLLSESGSKTDPEELTYDYVDSERISCIVNAAKNSLNLMQRRYLEPNTYTDNLPAIQNDSDDIYDDVDVPEHTQENAVDSRSPEQEMDRVYLDLISVKPSPGGSPVLGRASCQALDSEREGDSQPQEGTSKVVIKPNVTSLLILFGFQVQS
ncbi:UNVERIFIED_CONTAM: hypothetical protein FKN15_045779 [Acipenser sinensis]